MSRDLTPREIFFASIKTDPLQKVLDMEYRMSDGTVYKPYSEEDKKEIRQYRTLGRCDADMVLWIQKECERAGLDSYIVLNELEENLRELVKGNTENVEPEIQKWFDGELDKDFHYADTNNAYFKDYLMKKIQEEVELEKEFKMFDSVKEWYCEAYPSDELGEKIPEYLVFEGVYQGLEKGIDVYELLEDASDSIVRERIFEELATRKGVAYDVIYEMWLDCGRQDIQLDDQVIALIQSKQCKATNIQWDIDLEPGETYEDAIENIGLPSEIVLPVDLETEEEISEYLTYKTGFCHNGFEIEPVKEKIEDLQR